MPVNRNAAMIAGILILGACMAGSDSETCRADCRVPILLPEDPALPPESPELIRVAGGQLLNFDLNGRRPAQARTVVTFDQRAIEDENGNPVYSLELITGHNHRRARPYEADVCHAPAGCRYTVVNVGLSTRPAPLSAESVLIIDPDE